MSADKKRIAARLRSERKKRRLTVQALAEAFRDQAGEHDRRRMPALKDLCRMIRGYEAGEHVPHDRNRMLYAAVFDLSEDDLFGVADMQGVLAAPPIPGFLELERPPRMSGQPIDAGYVESIRETNQALVRLDTAHGGNDVLPLAMRVYRNAHHKLGAGVYLPEVERDLIAAIGETGEVAAWLAYDADRQAASRQIIHEALLLSRQAGDRNMELFELAHLSMQSIHLHRSAEGLRIATDVLDRGNLAPRVTAIFEIRRGRALAQLGDERKAFDALDKAQSALAEGLGPQDPYWTWWVTDAEVTWHQGMSRADLGDWGASIEPFQDSVSRRSARRARYNDLVHLLNALIRVQDWREAEPVLSEVAGQVNEIGSERTTNQLRRALGRVRADAPSAVADTAEELRGLLGKAPHPGVDAELF